VLFDSDVLAMRFRRDEVEVTDFSTQGDLTTAATTFAAVGSRVEAFIVSRSPNNGVFSLRKMCTSKGAFFSSNGRLAPSLFLSARLGTPKRRADFEDISLSPCQIIDEFEGRTSPSLVAILTDQPERL
jgi:hypothetical protein